MSDSLPPRAGGPLDEWPPGRTAGVFFLLGMLVGALVFWAATVLVGEQDSDEVATAVTSTTSSSITTPSEPAVTVPEAPATSDVPAAPNDRGDSGPGDDESASSADRAAQSDLRNVFTAARTISTDYQGRFQKNDAGDPIDGAALEAENPDSGVTYGPPGRADVDVVSVTVSSVDGPNSHIWLITQSSAGEFYCLGGTSDGEVSRSTGASEAAAKATCEGGVNEW